MTNLTNKSIYLDYAATTPIDPRVFELMKPFFLSDYGNPSSLHRFGQISDAAVENAREETADLFNCQSKEIIFTSCGSESDNLALRGAALAAKRLRKAKHILISPVEHHAVSHTAVQLAEVFGFELEYLPVNKYGQVSAKDVEKRLRESTAIVSVIFANNEIGSINPITEIAAVCNANKILFHTDAVQAAAHIDIDTKALGVDLLSFGAHKAYGPKGIGGLFVKEGTAILATQTGGGQEGGLRAGTSNVAYIVGQAEAFKIAKNERNSHNTSAKFLRDRLIEGVLTSIEDVQLTGHPVDRLANHASFVFKNVDGNELLMMLDIEGFACSSGSACRTGNPEPSEVLTAIGLAPEWALGSLRVTFGRYSTVEQVDHLLLNLPSMIERVRSRETK